ncbi:MAG: glycosyltransferase family 4 protein [Acidobacteriota bacterium]
MKILHLAAGNRWTGAAAPAFAEVEALREAGVDAHYAYVGGYKLEAKIGHLDFAHPIIRKAQNPVSFVHSVQALDRLVHRHGFDVVHAHLTHDHWLARLLARNHPMRIARTFHARRVLRNDPLSRALLGATQHRFVVNADFRDRVRGAIFTPPPLDHRQFSPKGPDARPLYALGDETLVTVIGKLSAGRGFEEALQTFAALRRLTPCRMMIIGHGEHRPALEALAGALDLQADLIWAGYHEDDLAEHYRASSLLLFTARGSDEGHRAILEALACGVPVVSYPLEGVHALLPPSGIAAAPTPEALAATAATLLSRERETLRQEAYERSLEFGYDKAAARLIAGYGG